MADAIEARFDIPSFKLQMDELGRDFERKTIRSAAVAAMRIIRAAVIRLTPVSRDFMRRGTSPGRLRRAIYMKRSKDSTNGREHYFIGVRQGRKERDRKSGNRDAYYWRWVESGHLARGPGQKIRGGNRRRALERKRLLANGARFVEAQSFLGEGFKQTGREALAKFVAVITARINAANKKKNRAYNKAAKSSIRGFMQSRRASGFSAAPIR